LLIIAGFWFSFSALSYWKAQNFGTLNPQIVLRKVIPAVSFFLLGFQLLASVFITVFWNSEKVPLPDLQQIDQVSYRWQLPRPEFLPLQKFHFLFSELCVEL